MDIIKLTEEHATLTAENASLTGQLATAQNDYVETLNALNEASANLTQANEAKAAVEKEKTDLQSSLDASAKEKADLLAQIETLKASQADFDKSLGAKVLEITGKGGNPLAEGQHQGKATVATITRQEFNTLSQMERNKFMRDGGKLSD